MWQQEVKLTSDYDFEGVRTRLLNDSLQQRLGDVLRIPIRVDAQPWIGQIGAKDRRTIVLTGDGPKDVMVEAMQRRFRLNEPNPSHELKQTTLAPIVETFGAERLVLDVDPFTALIRSIIHQQINLSFARVLTDRVFRTFGTTIDGVVFPPTQAELAGASVEDLRALQLSGRKVDYLLRAATAHLDFEQLRQAEDAVIAEQLIALKGVGPWTVQNVLMFGYGRSDLFPASDIGILRAFERLNGERPTVNEAIVLAEEFAPYRSHAAYLLWRSIE
ncbi:DNA-3-methyladenine glycosylase family protein [Exiguobacterium oxidotolerans]|uniref:DNA-3-methyladenine glycosylase II n=1 Tax=Exiguobacterium oxidotolerans TaxID=223958 RepID=A0A653IF80_9BACL|nr:DNA-3-methyladenine glycosylase 2 family protein [Exiguobacterium oxidotolerans]VWX37860.1 DNA repair protein [Exiguobacterium oxidotolerans]